MQLITEAAKASESGSAANANGAQSSPSTSMDRFYPPKPKISAFNELFMCHLCQGYMINPTTIDVCMHTYCRSCIARHLAADCYCPQCKAHGGKALTMSNLKSDEVLRSIIFKLVPGLYQKERERIVQFVNNTKTDGQFTETSSSLASSSSSLESKDEYLEGDEDIFSPTDPISLSLEYHPFLAKQCPEGAVPPVRYLQCPASVKVQHLKRFLCSKFDIDLSNKKVGIEIIYEDEVLPSDFTLMDVGYCYNWKRHAPLKFFYRILIYSDEQGNKLATPHISEDKVSPKSSETYLAKVTESAEPNRTYENTSNAFNGDAKTKPTSPFLPPPLTTKVKSNKSSSSSKHHPTHVTIAAKPVEAKKSVSKRTSLTEDFALPTTNDFKSLRSNDIRYSQYAVTSSSTSPSSGASASTHSHLKTKVKPILVKEEKPPKCDIVVSIPHNQMHEEWDSKPLAHLKTASKKSPNPHPAAACTTIPNDSNSSGHGKKLKNVPKLKIELNSLRTKLIEKPKSADIRLDSLIIKHHRPRKFSLDDKAAPERVDLQTYVKNIGLKPIEIQSTSTVVEPEVTEKFTPNASPRSSCSSSTTSSSNGLLNVVGDTYSTSSSSSHKKRKKKHSKDSKQPRDSKRKKMHAEISSRGADESLKMKVKLTAPLNIKPSKFESKKSPSSEKLQDPLVLAVSSKSLPTTPLCTFEKPLLPAIKPKDVEKEKSSNTKEKSKSSMEKKFKDSLKLKPLAIKTCAKDFEDDEDIIIPDTTATAVSLSKPLTNLIDDKLPHSPPLPPSLFKTTPITFSTFTPNNNSAVKSKPPTMQPKHNKDKFVAPTKMKPLAPKPMPVKPVQTPMKPPQFAVPNLPRLMANNSTKFLSSTPTSIASSANKHMGNLLKRSASVDDSKMKTAASLAKQPKLERPHQITVSAYGSNLQVTKVDVPATPTSSTAKATFEIPLYSPLSASYNPKCSFTVSSGTATSKAAKANLSLTINSNSGLVVSAAKSQVFSNSVAANKPDKDVLKKSSSSSSNIPAHSNKSTGSLMGPPLPLAKLNTIVPTAVKSPPLGSVLPLNSSSKTYTLTSSSNTTSAMPILAQAKASAHHHTEKRTEMCMTSGGKTTNGSTVTDKTKSSLRQFRLPSRESGQDILDLSSAVPKTTTSNGLQGLDKKSLSIPASATTTAGTSLEMALTKIKQNMTNTVNQDNNNMVGGIELKPNSDDLQNLHLLSESATAREKIAINSSVTTVTASLYEKAKINQNTLVRQQNASVRSIPNPSALAFRNHQPTNNIPMVTIAAPLLASFSNDVDKPILAGKQPLSPSSPLSPNCSTSTSPLRTGSSTLLSSKKHPSIDQVAASLNIRASAAAAAEATAKANLKHLDESTLVTSTSSAAETGEGSKLKQIKQETPEHTTNHECAQTSLSTVHSSSANTLAEVVEIKQEPEEKFHDSTLAEEQQRLVVRAPTLPGATKTTPMTTVATASKVENLVTSVINVSTPTSTLLTASSAGY